MRKTRHIFLFSLLIFCFILSLSIGEADISFSQTLAALLGENQNIIESNLILNHRFPKSLTAILLGISLPVSGFLLQEVFHNPLAGPSILGITSASGLGVAVVIFLFGLMGIELYFLENWILVVSAFLGAILVMILLLFYAKKTSSLSGLVLIGFMIAGIASALIGLMQYFAESEKIKTYLIWSFGSLSGLTWLQIWVFLGTTTLGLFLSFFCLKGLSALQLGEEYAISSGIKLKPLKIQIIFCTAILTATATAFTGPIAFIGIAIPHVCRSSLKDYRVKELWVTIILVGMISMLIFMMISELLPNGGLPINLITTLIGAPIVIHVILKNKTLS